MYTYNIDETATLLRHISETHKAVERYIETTEKLYRWLRHKAVVWIVYTSYKDTQTKASAIVNRERILLRGEAPNERIYKILKFMKRKTEQAEKIVEDITSSSEPDTLHLDLTMLDKKIYRLLDVEEDPDQNIYIYRIHHTRSRLEIVYGHRKYREAKPHLKIEIKYKTQHYFYITVIEINPRRNSRNGV